MMSEIIDDGYSVYFAANFTAPTDALESCQRLDNRLGLDSPCIGSNNDSEAIAHIELSDNWCAKLGPFKSFTIDAKAGYSSGVVDVTCLPASVFTGAEGFHLSK